MEKINILAKLEKDVFERIKDISEKTNIPVPELINDLLLEYFNDCKGKIINI